MVYNI